MSVNASDTVVSRELAAGAICSSIGVILFAVITPIVAYAFNISLLHAGAYSLAANWCIAIFAGSVNAVRGKLTSGAVLVNCGPHPTRWVFLFGAVIFGATAFPAGQNNGWLGTAQWIVTPFLLSMALFQLVMFAGHIRLCDNGIWQYFGLIKWPSIASWHWDTETQNVVVLQLTPRNRLPGWRVSLAIPPEHHQTVDQLLGQRIGFSPNNLADPDGQTERDA